MHTYLKKVQRLNIFILKLSTNFACCTTWLTCYIFVMTILLECSWRWKGNWALCLSCICLLAMRTLICVTFSLFFWCQGFGAISASGSSWTFLFTFLNESAILHSHTMFEFSLDSKNAEKNACRHCLTKAKLILIT